MPRLERFKEQDIPYDDLAKFGLTQEMIDDLPQSVMTRLLSSRETPLLPLTTKTVDGAVDVGGATLKLAAQGTIALSFKDGISKPGSYTLASFGTLAEPGISGWTLPARTGDDKFKIDFTTDNGQLVARVIPAGLQIIIR